ncbi:tRNA (adenosine(37)-N6)-threonylcarbamoyltransferase complex ATPase subunit type 1 TsaE [bacterium]|nr:tRNA (adenosine(37)-N6)-threonylcarbamoyltransferase complex ATPase subunit type 1 TsaE [bacterium]
MGGFSTIISHSEADTIALGIKIAAHLPDEIIIPVTGSLGVGKSVLIRGIAKGLGYEGRVRSPSYVIERVYDTPRGQLHHWDLYRIESQSETEYVFEEIRMQKGIRLIEWGERLVDYLRDRFPIIEMEFQDEPDTRLIRIDKRIKS